MADFLLRDIDDKVAERIKELARQRGWPLNDVILHLVKQALGLAEPNAAKFLDGLTVRKIIIVPGKIVNIVAG